MGCSLPGRGPEKSIAQDSVKSHMSGDLMFPGVFHQEFGGALASNYPNALIACRIASETGTSGEF